ncbi:FAD-dependent oxidoreductase [Arthrobacter psychrolactophilus]
MNFDVAVVGAGPAGLSAAVHAANSGLNVVLVDAGQQPGGQFWRHRNEAVAGHEAGEGAGHHDWKRFVELRERLYAHEQAGRLTYLRGTQLWLVEAAGIDGSRILRLSPTLDVAPVSSDLGRDATPDSVRARHLILCPGGYDRQLPVPGWACPASWPLVVSRLC